MMCRWHGVPEMMTPAMRTTAVLLGFFKLDKHAMFSFAMTSGLTSVSDNLKIIITLHRAQEFRDTGPYKNLICCLLSVPLGAQASARRWDCLGLGNVARRCFGTKWYGDVPGARSTRDGDTGNEDNSSFAWFIELDKYVMFSSAMTSGLAIDSDEMKNIKTPRQAPEFRNTRPYKNSICCLLSVLLGKQA